MAGKFGAVVTAMVTPFRDDFSLDLDGAQELVRYLLDHGSDTVLVAGSTGESPTLTHDEKGDLFRAAVEAAQGKGRIWCGTGTYSTAESVELTRMAQEAGADAVLVVTPYYNIPGRTASRIEHDTLLQLAAVPNIVAVKDSTGDFDGVSRLIDAAPTGFEVYSGDDWATFGLVCLGAVGVVSVASHLVGDRIHEMVALIGDGDVPAARKIHEELSPVFKGLFITSNPIPLKAALELLGRPAGPPRLPLVPATPNERETLRRALEDAGLL